MICEVGHAATVDQPEGVADLAVAGEHFVEQDVGAGEQAEVLTEQHFTPLLVRRGAVELTNVDVGRSAVGFAVVDGHPEGRATAQLDVVDLLAEIETDVVRQEAHLHPRLLAIELLAIAAHITVDVEGVEVAVGRKGHVVLFVQHDLGQGSLADRHGDGTGQGQRQQCSSGFFVVVHGALRLWTT